MARAPGLVKGKGGSMHLFDVENGFLGGYGIVGGHIPLGVGMAYALRYQETDGIVQLYLGDGAIHNGAFHEAANLAGLWGRDGMNPCLFILENNQYGMGTSVERATAKTDSPRSSTPTASSTKRSTAWTSTPCSRSPSAPRSGCARPASRTPSRR